MASQSLPLGGGGKLLGQIFLDRGQLSESQLDQAVALQAHRSERLGELLCELGHVDRQSVRQALVEQSRIPHADLQQRPPSAEAISVVSADLAFRHKVLPLEMHNNTLCLAMADPFDRGAVEAVRVLTGKHIERH